MGVKIRNAMSPRMRVGVGFAKQGRTKQSMKEECDINNILRKYRATGHLSHVRQGAAEYGHAPATTFHEAMDMVISAQQMFKDLPASLRRRFDNDPAEFLKFAQDEKNLDEMRELGLAKPAAEQPPEVEVVTEKKEGKDKVKESAES